MFPSAEHWNFKPPVLKGWCMVHYHIFALDNCQIYINLFQFPLFSVLSLEKDANFLLTSRSYVERPQTNSRRRAAPVLFPVLFFFFFFIGRPNTLDFTVSQVHLLLRYQPQCIMVLCVVCTLTREACARVCPLFIIARLAILPADPSLLCYLRADKGGRCEEEINVNPSVFN